MGLDILFSGMLRRGLWFSGVSFMPGAAGHGKFQRIPWKTFASSWFLAYGFDMEKDFLLDQVNWDLIKELSRDRIAGMDRQELVDSLNKLKFLSRLVTHRYEVLRRLLDESEALFFIKDAAGRYVHANAAWIRSREWPVENPLGHADRELFPGEVAAEHQATDQYVLEAMDRVVEVHRRESPDGEPRWIMYNVFPIATAEGEVFIGGVGLDVTNEELTREKLRLRLHQIQAMSDASPDALIMIDSSGMVQYWSRSACEMFGWTEEEAMGRDLHELVAPVQYHGKAKKGLEHFARTGEGAYVGNTNEFDAKHKDGSIFPVERSMASFQMDGKWYAVGNVRDISERRADEEILKAVHREILAVNAQLVEKQRVLDEDLAVAAQVQMSLLPKGVPIPGVEIGWTFKPSAAIGGDIFNAIRVADRYVVGYMVDVCGHGAAAALVTVSLHQTLGHLSGVLLEGGRPRSPEAVLWLLEQEYPLERFDKYFTMVYMVLDVETGELRYCNAGHPPPLLVRKSGDTEWLGIGGTVVGIGAPTGFKEAEVRLAQGDLVVMYTDAMLEHENSQGEQFGIVRFEQSVLRQRRNGPGVDLEAVYGDLKDFGAGSPIQDDVTLLSLEYKGKP